MSEFSEEELYGAIARGWCDERNSDKEFDANLADAIAIEVLAVVRPLYTQNKQLKASVGFIEGTIEEAKNVPCWVNMPEEEHAALIARIAKLEKVAEAARELIYGVQATMKLFDSPETPIGPMPTDSTGGRLLAALAELEGS